MTPAPFRQSAGGGPRLRAHRLIRRLLVVACCLTLSACASLFGQSRETQEASRGFARVSGAVTSAACAACPTIVVALGDSGAAAGSPAYRVYTRPGRFDMLIPGDARYLFAFNDLNQDSRFEAGEPGGWLSLPQALAAGQRADHLELNLKADGADTFPAIGKELKLRGMALGEIAIRLGDVAGLGDARFDPQVGGLGMWQPWRFMDDGYAGIYFLQPYAPDKTPVLFIHGVRGTPRDFAPMIARLDRRKYQPWVLYYPSGLEVDAVGDGMHAMLSELQHRYRFRPLDIVAYSLGGLATRSYLDACAANGDCPYLRAFISISAPFGGEPAAQDAVDHSPVVLPVWRSMAPRSRFLRGLFREPLPAGVRHHVLFSYRDAGSAGAACGDGKITLASQLRREAQQQAASVRGFNVDHVNMLAADEVLDEIVDVLASDEALLAAEVGAGNRSP